MRRLLLVVAAAWGLACAGGSEPQEGVAIQALFRSWVHAVEEEVPGSNVQVYRPGVPEDFPPSRFRMRFVFHADGRCEWSALDAADAHTVQSGSWSRAGADTSIIQVLEPSGQHVVSFRIVALTAEVLRIARLEP